MSLKITKVVNGSKPDEELIWLKASKDMNVQGFAVVDKTFAANGTQSNKFRHIFIFPDMEIKAGDFIKLYSGKGKNKSLPNDAKTVNHYFYWHADECVWNDGGDTVRLIKFSVDDTHKIEAVKK